MNSGRHDRMPVVTPIDFPGPVSWPAVFGRDAPLELELGCGRPHYLFDRAKEVPQHDVVGIEWKARWVKAANRKMAREGITNICAVHGNAWLLAGAFFRPQSLQAIHLNFPDPWWKKKHEKRRIVSDAFVDVLAKRLVPGGIFFVHTDVASLLEQYLERMEAHPLLKNPYGGGRLCPRKPFGARSHREKKCQADHIPTFMGLVERVTP